MSDYAVLPVTSEIRDDLVALFEVRGGPRYGWCTSYRFPGVRQMSKRGKRSAMARRVQHNGPIREIAYRGDRPVGWCSNAPRVSYAGLTRSRTMPRVTDAATSTWTVLCFFVHRSHRGKGVAGVLLPGGIRYARSQGERVIESYRFDAGGTTATNRGHSHLFAAASFDRDGRRFWPDLDAASPLD